MKDLDQAKAAILDYLAQFEVGAQDDPLNELVIVSESTQEHDFGWVFFYTAKGTLNIEPSFSNCPSPYTLGGNAPLIYERECGKILATGTAEHLDYYLSNYRKLGDSHRNLAQE